MKTFCCLNLSLLGVLLIVGVCQGDASKRFEGTSEVSWDSANKDCEKRGMNLLDFETMDWENLANIDHSSYELVQYWSAKHAVDDTTNADALCPFFTYTGHPGLKLCSKLSSYICE